MALQLWKGREGKGGKGTEGKRKEGKGEERMTYVSGKLPLCQNWVRTPDLSLTSYKTLVKTLAFLSLGFSQCQNLRSSPKLLFICSKTSPSIHSFLPAAVLSYPKVPPCFKEQAFLQTSRKRLPRNSPSCGTWQGTALPVSGKLPTAVATIKMHFC